MMIGTIIQRQVAIVELEVLRRGCRIAAKRNKAKGDYDRTKKWNDLAYQGDYLVARVKK